MTTLDPIDEIQSHILGVLTGLMISYNLNPDQVKARYDYILSLSPQDISNVYQSPSQPTGEIDVNNLTPLSAGRSWGDYNDDIEASIDSNDYLMDIDDVGSESIVSEESIESEVSNETPDTIYVSTRKEFCSTMQKGIRICPRYSTCKDAFCKNFHVKDEHICPHVTRGSYCDTEGCDLIVIRACRKGRKCNDSECSFRHR